MADRLQELLQQRALIKEHLAWLEGEISAASGRAPEAHEPVAQLPGSISRADPVKAVLTAAITPASAPAAAVVSPSLLTKPAVPSPTRDETDAMIARLAAQEKTTPVPTKKGCWVFFCVTLLSLGAAAWAALYFFYRG